METIPKYREIMDYIQEQIQNHVYQQNAKLPTEQELSEQFDVSRPTVVKALDRLRDMGIVYRVQGSGTFVNEGYTAATQQGSNIISVVLPFAQYRDTARLDEMNILKGIEKRLSQHGFFTMIHYCKDNGEDFIETIKAVKSSLSAGIIAYVAKDVMDCGEGEIYELFMGDYPFVLVDQPIIGINLPCVRTDNVKGAVMATKHLVDCGYDTIYFLSDVNLNYNESIRERYIGYCQVVQNYKGLVNFNHILITYPEQDVAQITDIIQQLLDKHKGQRIGLFCTGDYFASRIYKILLSLGCRTPSQVGIVGFDGLGIQLPDNKQLTTIAQNFYGIGKLASETMLRRLSDPTMPPDTIKAEARLIEGETTAVRE